MMIGNILRTIITASIAVGSIAITLSCNNMQTFNRGCDNINSVIQLNTVPIEIYGDVDKNSTNISSFEYITPEMFGAKADGITNDAEAFRKAFEITSTLYLNEGDYYLGEEVIDLSKKNNIEIIGKNRQSIISGGTFVVNIDSTWTTNNMYKKATQPLYPVHISGITFTKMHSDTPAIVCACPVLIENCGIMAYHKFLAMPNTCYVDRVNFFECNIWLDKEKDATGTLIIGCDGVGQYSDWKGNGDNWYFKDCSFSVPNTAPLFHVGFNYSVLFQNCINPIVCYGSDNNYSNFPMIFFDYCHIENRANVCSPKSGYSNNKAVVNYNNCYFHSFSSFNKDDNFTGLNYYVSRKPEDDFSMGLTPDELYRFNGIIVPNGSNRKHRKDLLTKYSIPSSRNIYKDDDSTGRTRTRVSTLDHDVMDYVFFYSTSPKSYDASTKISISNVIPNNEQNIIWWNVQNANANNFYLHIFRRNLTTNQIQKCVVYIGFMWERELVSGSYYIMQDGGNTIEGVYKWVDYNGAFPE